MIELAQLRDTLRVRPVDGMATLSGYDAASTELIGGKSEANAQLAKMQQKLFDAHDVLFASKQQSVLLVLQGLDCSGKNGTIKHVVIALNPAGVRIASFKEPTDEEEEHHFLWRHRQELPEPGELSVFDRSHYEDLIVPLALNTSDESEVDKRIEEVNEFEKELVEGGTTIIKCLLHLSYDEQRERFLRRLRRDDKRWKFSLGDLETRRKWDEFQAAYGTVIAATSTELCPWYVIPSDHKWYRNWAIAQLLLGTLDSMGLAYPQPEFDLETIRAELAAPN